MISYYWWDYRTVFLQGKKKLLQLSEPFLLEELEIQSDFEEVGAISEPDV